jgi:hypothetical protein
VQPPGGSWQSWLSETSLLSATYGAGDPGYSGAGAYLFEARLRSVATGDTSGWSPAIKLAVG